MPDRRGAPNGLILRKGHVVAEWGDTRRVDLTFSVTKSVLATVAGLALDRGLIDDVHDPVHEYVDDGGFESPHNRRITWHHLLQGTSEWRGELFGKPDRADRREGEDRDLRDPGTFWEYNDVRVNRLSLSLLRVWEKPLPAVFRDEVMDPVGASDTWQWHGYDNSDVTVAGERITSVSGGGHWGGGLWIDSRDLARFGHLHLNRGRWRDRRILSSEWVDAATTPCDIKPEYGYLWWLNTDGILWPDVSHDSFAALGHGSNIVWIHPEHDIVAVVRWFSGGDDKHEHMNGLFRRIVDALESSDEG
ncbi:serine hydrolase domain-containing protein [Halobaculum sp. EA56]|uniref:serine hydrolase domain-containing protein n=1 Tax=Halobaculum sp. EA56 TaxID=3421648 RepID=UPI003EB7D63C